LRKIPVTNLNLNRNNMNPVLYDFIGGETGEWMIRSMNTVSGEPLQEVSHIHITTGSLALLKGNPWVLKGFNSNMRYAEKQEYAQLTAIQAGLGRPEATCAALIPIRKSDAWWALAQDERRAIFEQQSHHTATGLQYLPAIARKLYHCRDIGEPFDFLTWFEYAPEHANAFEELVLALRATEEWKYVDREIDIRLTRSIEG
jgi:Chlorite dismutase